MLTVKFEKLALRNGAKVLDLGCGEGRHIHGLHMLGTVNAIGIDLDAESLDKARAGLDSLPSRDPDCNMTTEFQLADALTLPFPDDHFDAIICSEVLEHIDAYRDVLNEIRRVLKLDGKLCVSVPRAWPEKICWRLAPTPDGYAFQPGGHIRIFNAVELKQAIVSAGFTYDTGHHAHGLHAPLWWLKCLFWSRREDHPAVKAYHRFLVWHLMKKPFPLRILEAILNPIMGKSLVLYFGSGRRK